MKRRLVLVARAVSLAMLVAAVVLWVSTYLGSMLWNGYVLSQTGAEFRPLFFELETNRGEVRLRLARYHVRLQNLTPADQKTAGSIVQSIKGSGTRLRWFGPWDFVPRDRSVLGWVGLEAWQEHWARKVDQCDGVRVNLPLWFLCAVLAILPSRTPVRRMVQAWRHASARPQMDEEASRRATALLWGCAAAFVLLVVTTLLTWTIGWSVRVTVGKAFCEVAAQDRNLSLTVVRDWPLSQRVTFLRRPERTGLLFPYRENGTPMETRSLPGVTWLGGDAYFFRDEDGAVSLMPFGKDPAYARLGPPAPYTQIRISLPGLAFLVMVPPVMWLARRTHRRLRQYKELKELLCARCGYSLVGNVTGVCSECGRKVLRSA